MGFHTKCKEGAFDMSHLLIWKIASNKLCKVVSLLKSYSYNINQRKFRQLEVYYEEIYCGSKVHHSNRQALHHLHPFATHHCFLHCDDCYTNSKISPRLLSNPARDQFLRFPIELPSTNWRIYPYMAWREVAVFWSRMILWRHLVVQIFYFYLRKMKIEDSPSKAWIRTTVNQMRILPPMLSPTTIVPNERS